jgi:hypothetical protein
MRKQVLLIFFFFSYSIFSFSQGFEIIYDAQNGTLKYFLDNVEMASPTVKRGQKITLKVENYNNYLYDIDIKETHDVIKVGDGENMLAGLQSLGGNQMGDILQGQMIPSLGESDADGVVDYMDKELDYNESEQQRLIRILKKQAVDKIAVIDIKKDQFSQRNLAIGEYKKTYAFNTIALEEVNKLKYDPNISTHKIKTISTGILVRALNIENFSEVSLDRVINQNKQDTELKEILASHTDDQANYTKDVATLKQIQQELVQLDPNSIESLAFYLDMEKTISESPKVLKETENTATALDSLIEIFENRSLQDVMSMWYEYEEIKSHTFSKTYVTNAESDIMTFDITLKLKDSAPENTVATEVIEMTPIKLSVYGGMKINASVGINFAQFFNKPKSYFIKDSFIVGQNGDSFIPIITSFVHFYQQNKKAVSFGGSLGIGIPIGGEGLESTTFLVGPSLFFGQSERFVLNAGIMGSKINRLSGGYEEGDFYDGNNDFIPMKSFYELGYFVGLSFNLRN